MLVARRLAVMGVLFIFTGMKRQIPVSADVAAVFLQGGLAPVIPTSGNLRRMFPDVFLEKFRKMFAGRMFRGFLQIVK